MIKTGTKIQGVDTESKLQIDVLDLAEKLQLLPKDEASRLNQEVSLRRKAMAALAAREKRDLKELRLGERQGWLNGRVACFFVLLRDAALGAKVEHFLCTEAAVLCTLGSRRWIFYWRRWKWQRTPC
eukprot:symbB.v1.2.030562.t1/scaffold3370.1/size58273/4